MCSMSNISVLINSEVVRIKEQKLVKEVNKHLSGEEKMQLKASKSGVERFKKCLAFASAVILAKRNT